MLTKVQLEADNEALMDQVLHLQAQHQGSFHALRSYRNAISHVRGAFKLWASVLGGPLDRAKNDRVISEMRDVQKKIEAVLNG